MRRGDAMRRQRPIFKTRSQRLRETLVDCNAAPMRGGNSCRTANNRGGNIQIREGLPNRRRFPRPGCERLYSTPIGADFEGAGDTVHRWRSPGCQACPQRRAAEACSFKNAAGAAFDQPGETGEPPGVDEPVKIRPAGAIDAREYEARNQFG